MKVLVTGGAGFIGSHVVDLYIASGYEVVIVDDLSTGRLVNLNPEATFYQLDIRSPQLEDIFGQERPDFVNHHAAQMDVRKSVAEPYFDADVNILGSINIIECARRFKVNRFLYISSGGAVYGEPIYLPCDEEHPVNPICQYGASKHTVEHYLYMYSQNYGLEYVVLRYPNVYGPRQDPKGEAGVVAIFTGQMLSGEQVVINGDGEQVRDFVFVKDCAQANLLALTEMNSSGIYNLGAGRGTSINEIFSHLKEQTSYERDASYGPAKLGETRQIFLDAAKARNELNWVPSTTLEEGLAHTVEYFQNPEHIFPMPLYQGLEKAKPHSAITSEPVADKMPATFHEKPHFPSKQELPLSNETREKLDNLRIFYEMLNGKEDPQIYLQNLLKISLKSVAAVSGSAIVINGEGNAGEGILFYNDEILDPDDSSSYLNDILSDGLAGWVLKSGQAALIRSTREDSRWLKRSWDESEATTRTAMSVPLISKNRVIGVLTAVRPEPNQFEEDDLAILSTIAALTSVNDHGWSISET